MKRESLKLKDLEFLKSQSHPSPSSSTEEVTKYIENTKKSKKKNTRMYRKIRYAKC